MQWSPRPGSNRRPLPYQGSALPAELRGPRRCVTRGQRAPAVSQDGPILDNHRSTCGNLCIEPRICRREVFGWEVMVGREGIEPPQSKTADLQSAELTTCSTYPRDGRHAQHADRSKSIPKAAPEASADHRARFNRAAPTGDSGSPRRSPVASKRRSRKGLARCTSGGRSSLWGPMPWWHRTPWCASSTESSISFSTAALLTQPATNWHPLPKYWEADILAIRSAGWTSTGSSSETTDRLVNLRSARSKREQREKPRGVTTVMGTEYLGRGGSMPRGASGERTRRGV